MTHQAAVTRRRFVQTSAAGSIALAGVGFGRATQAQTAKPNIVFIMADDLGFADVSCYGQRDYTTPNVDRLALEGMKFTQAYANSAVCSATRTALITGRYRSEEHTSELQSPCNLVCRLLLEKKKKKKTNHIIDKSQFKATIKKDVQI